MENIVTFLATIIIPLLSLYVVYITNRKNQLQQQLNDKKREIYSTYMDALETALNIDTKNKKTPNPDELKEKIFSFKRQLILYGSSKSIKACNKWILDNVQENNEKNFMNIENLVRSLREEIGLSNKGLKKLDLLQLYINEDLQKALRSGKLKGNIVKDKQTL